MGLFDKLTKKNNCNICGEKIGLLDATLADGYLCKACKKKLSPYFDLSKKNTVEQIQMQLRDREVTNRERLAQMTPNRIYGDFGVILIDEAHQTFAVLPDTSDGAFKSAKAVSSLADVIDKNPDVISFSQVNEADLDLRVTSREEKKTVDGKQVSYDPKHFTYMCDFTMRIKVDHPYLESVYVPLCNGTVQIPVDEPRKVTRLDREFAAWFLDMPDLVYEKNAAYNTSGDLMKLIFGNASGLPDYSYGFRVSYRNEKEIRQYAYYLAMAAEIKKALQKQA